MIEREINPITIINCHLLELKEHYDAAKDPGKRNCWAGKLLSEAGLTVPGLPAERNHAEGRPSSAEALITSEQAGGLLKGAKHALLHKGQQAASLSRPQVVPGPTSRRNSPGYRAAQH